MYFGHGSFGMNFGHGSGDPTEGQCEAGGVAGAGIGDALAVDEPSDFLVLDPSDCDSGSTDDSTGAGIGAGGGSGFLAAFAVGFGFLRRSIGRFCPSAVVRLPSQRDLCTGSDSESLRSSDVDDFTSIVSPSAMTITGIAGPVGDGVEAAAFRVTRGTPSLAWL